jgi:hypothetical protein
VVPKNLRGEPWWLWPVWLVSGLLAVHSAGSGDWKGLIAVAVSVVLLGGAFAVIRRTNR